jgi:hypothetical protein
MPPQNHESITYFAKTDARNRQTPFGIKASDRTRHVYVIGKTGMGKSTLLENMAIQDIKNGEGFAFIDPHGKTADLLLDYIPDERVNDVIYFAPFDMDNPIAFNVMEDVGYDKRHLVVAGLMAAFKKIWVDAWSARMEYILQNTLLALLEYPDATMLDVNRMYTDRQFREKVVGKPGNSKLPPVDGYVKDPLVKSFWLDEYASFTDRYTQEATPAIQNKIGQFTGNPLIRNIIGQSKSTFDLRQMMDERKILIVNLSKGQVGEGNANLLGSMLITKIYLAALSRADVSQSRLEKLPNFYLYVDEFQSFANESFADILSEARKYKLNLTMAHQYIEQMSDEVRAAVFGNVGTMIAFRVGAFDAEVLEKEFSPQFMAQDLVNLSFTQIYLRLMIDGVSSQPFSARTLPPIAPPEHSSRADVIGRSQRQFARPRPEVEAMIINKYTEQQQEKERQAKEASSVARELNVRAELGHGVARNNDTNHGERGTTGGAHVRVVRDRTSLEVTTPSPAASITQKLPPPESTHQPFAGGLKHIIEEMQARPPVAVSVENGDSKIEVKQQSHSLGESVREALRKEKERVVAPDEKPALPRKNLHNRGATPERMQSLREALVAALGDVPPQSRPSDTPPREQDARDRKAVDTPPPQSERKGEEESTLPRSKPGEIPEAVLKKVLEVET